MRKDFLILVTVFLAVPSLCFAQQQHKNRFLVGFTILTPHVSGVEDGPAMVLGNLQSADPVNFDRSFLSNSLFGIWMGPWIHQLRTFFVASYRYVQIGNPSPASGMEFELSGRCVFWRYDFASLSGIVSVKNSSFTSDDNPFQHGYSFEKSFWLPGIGLGANLGMIHGEVLLYGWLGGTVIAYAAEPNGLPPNSYSQARYDPKPVYLNYAISLTLGLEFEVFGF